MPFVLRSETMENHLEKYKEAVRKAIAEAHARGLPVYQSKEGYIVAIYPGDREVRLQKEKPYIKPAHAN